MSYEGFFKFVSKVFFINKESVTDFISYKTVEEKEDQCDVFIKNIDETIN